MNESITAAARADEGPRHIALINDEGQYSLWQEQREIPEGWTHVPIPADWEQGYRDNHPDASSKEVCLAYVGEVWTDMRPLSVRRVAEARANAETTTGDA